MSDILSDVTDEIIVRPHPGIVTLTLGATYTGLAIDMAKKACIGGSSAVRQEDRSARLLEDQIIGQMGQMALSLYWFGTPQPYLDARAYANAHPTEGDGGSDILDMNLDVKTSLMRASDDPFSYRMLVRPRERHEGNVYILALIPKLLKVDTQVNLVGWVADHELPKNPATMGQFAGAYLVTADQLHPLPPIRWRG